MKFLTLFIYLLNINYSKSFESIDLFFKIKNSFNDIPKESTLLKIINPIDEINSNKSVLFLPARSINPLPSEMYNNFLNSLSNKDIKIYIPNNQNIELLFDELSEKNDSVTIVSHSNSALKAIEYSNNYDFINNLVLLDPLDSRSKNDKTITEIIEIDNINDINKNNINIQNNIINIKNIDNLLIINSKKSNDWNIFPTIFPIGFFSLKLSNLNISESINKDIIKVDLFGHFDILDTTWSNIIHTSLSRGFDDRNSIKLQQYHSWLANQISNII